MKVCGDCGRVIGYGHARGCRHPKADADRRDVAPAWLSPASYRDTTDEMRRRLAAHRLQGSRTPEQAE